MIIIHIMIYMVNGICHPSGVKGLDNGGLDSSAISFMALDIRISGKGKETWAKSVTHRF